MTTQRAAPVWTEGHSRVAIAGILMLVGVAAALFDDASAVPLMMGALGLTFVLGMLGDGWLGIVVGLAIAGGVAFLRQLGGTWTPEHFGTAVLESVGLLGTGWAAGSVGKFLRLRATAYLGLGADDALGVFGSLGMLPADLALVRLEEEVARASVYQRPLSLMLVDIKLLDRAIDAASREEVARGVARLTESLLRETDVPFALTPQRVGAILPETGSVAATIAIGRVLDAIGGATYTDRRVRRRRSVASVAGVRAVVVSLGDAYRTARELLDAASASIESRIAAGTSE
jgi:GGDEF domain-containing protein